jgi:hypothetical protein
MSKKNNNVNPDHFKTAGREPPGRGLAHDLKHQEYEEIKANEKRNGPTGAAKGAGKPRVNNKDKATK